ncbi:MAG: cytochrome c biogenesis protein CcsA [Bacteroidales bacterium]|nr:cytochrome c biogenesis protein CcsA [Bacteroidales bacterium]
MQPTIAQILKRATFGLFILTTLVLVGATAVEHVEGTRFAAENIYGAGWFVALWAVLAVFSLAFMLMKKLYRRPAVFLLHISFIIILLGAAATWFSAERGTLHLRIGANDNKYLTDKGLPCDLPFTVRLDDFSVVYYSGTNTPCDFVSKLTTTHESTESEHVVSMNNIADIGGYRIYQSAFDDDGGGSIFSVAHDPYGIPITYTGYILLLISMLLFFFDKKSNFRQLLTKAAIIIIFISLPSCSSGPAPRSISPDAADRFGQMLVLYNGRICPVQTLANDFVTKLYGKQTYKGLSAEQVLCGWIFRFDDWRNEPMIKITDGDVREALGGAKYVSLSELYEAQERGAFDLLSEKQMSGVYERTAIISMLYAGELLKLYPVADTNGVGWYSQQDQLPTELPENQAIFIGRSMDLMQEYVVSNNTAELLSLIDKTIEYQRKTAHDILPSDAVVKAERLYNRASLTRPLFMICLTIGILSFIVFCLFTARQRAVNKPLNTALIVAAALVFACLTFIIGLRWFVSGHVPLSNGPETMQFLAWCAIGLVLPLHKRYQLIVPFGFIICGLTLLVSTLGAANPQITQLVPVLSSPLLSIHVAIVMVAYALFAFIMLNGVVALLLSGNQQLTARLERIGRLMLYPAVFCLTAGIFVGAVWANISWGRYWGWDPKEVWALISLMVYSLPLHSKWLCNRRFHWFAVGAFLCVLMTYFGVNYLLGGMHSYA